DAVDEVRVPIERRHQPIDDRRDVIEPDLEERLSLDSLEVELQLVELDLDADIEVEQLEHLRLQRDLRVEVLDLEVERIELDDRHVEEDVRGVGVLRALALGVSAVLLLSDRLLTVHVLREPVLLSLLRGAPAVGGALLGSGCHVQLPPPPPATCLAPLPTPCRACEPPWPTP